MDAADKGRIPPEIRELIVRQFAAALADAWRRRQGLDQQPDDTATAPPTTPQAPPVIVTPAGGDA